MLSPVDEETLRYLAFTGRSEEQVRLVEAYTKAQGLFHSAESPEPLYSETVELDLGTVEPSLAGPTRPQDRIRLREAKSSFLAALKPLRSRAVAQPTPREINRLENEIGDPAWPVDRVAYPPPVIAQPETAAQEISRWGRGHRRDHQLHEHLEPFGDDGRGPAGPKGGGTGPPVAKLGQDQPVPPARASSPII